MKKSKIFLTIFLSLFALCTCKCAFAADINEEEYATITINNTYVAIDGAELTEDIMDSFYIGGYYTIEDYSNYVSKNGNINSIKKKNMKQRNTLIYI